MVETGDEYMSEMGYGLKTHLNPCLKWVILNPDLKWVMFVNLGMKLAMVKTSIF
jgi:hypothetical protein